MDPTEEAYKSIGKIMNEGIVGRSPSVASAPPSAANSPLWPLANQKTQEKKKKEEEEEEEKTKDKLLSSGNNSNCDGPEQKIIESTVRFIDQRMVHHLEFIGKIGGDKKVLYINGKEFRF